MEEGALCSSRDDSISSLSQLGVRAGLLIKARKDMISVPAEPG
jgi:hypothetical protein